MNIDKLRWLGHASFYIQTKDGFNIYIDPYNLKANMPKADLILITHGHYDHCSPKDIENVYKIQTTIVGARSAVGELKHPVTVLKPGDKSKILGVDIEAIPAYNIGKKFHPKENGNLGFIITVDGIRIYHAGDTDVIPEMKEIKADVALLPVGGTYTMSAREAAEAVNAFKPAIAIPMHYGSVAGSPQDAADFKRLCKSEVRILNKD